MLGSWVKVIVDRPLGSTHPQYQDLIYPVNYGYIEGTMAPDGEEQDAYILGIEVPLKEDKRCQANICLGLNCYPW